MRAVLQAPRAADNEPRDDGLQVSLGPGGVWAVNARHLAARAAVRVPAPDDPRALSAPDAQRCLHCGFALTDDMKLPIYDPGDQVLAPRLAKRPATTGVASDSSMSDSKAGDAVAGEAEGDVDADVDADLEGPDELAMIGRDWVRVPQSFDAAAHPQLELWRDDVAVCTPNCCLAFMHDCELFDAGRVADLVHKMMVVRHDVDEPVGRAPAADALAYRYVWRPAVPASADPAKVGVAPTGPIGSGALSAAAFYGLLEAAPWFVAYVAPPYMFVPPFPGEQDAFAKRDARFLMYWYRHLLPAPLAAELHCGGVLATRGRATRARVPPAGVVLDAPPDSADEADFVSGDLHPSSDVAAYAAAATASHRAAVSASAASGAAGAVGAASVAGAAGVATAASASAAAT